MRRWLVPLLLLVLGSASDESVLSVLVLPLKAERVDPALARTVDDVLATLLDRRGSLRVTTFAMLDSVLSQEKLKDALGCDDVACLSELSGAVGSDRLLRGSIGRLGEKFVLSLQWFDAHAMSPLNSVSRTAESEGALSATVEAAVRELLGEPTTPARQTQRRFWTAEAVGGVSATTTNRVGTANSQMAPAVGLRFSWGGRQSGGSVYYYALGGWEPLPWGLLYAGARLSVPVAFGDKLRVVASATVGRTLGPTEPGPRGEWMEGAQLGVWWKSDDWWSAALMGALASDLVDTDPLLDVIKVGAEASWIVHF